MYHDSAYKRRMDYLKARRKERINPNQYDNLHQYSKNKVSQKSADEENIGLSIADRRKIEALTEDVD